MVLHHMAKTDFSHRHCMGTVMSLFQWIICFGVYQLTNATTEKVLVYDVTFLPFSIIPSGIK